MVTVHIKRITEWDGETYGVMSLNGRPRFVVLEEAWRNNQRNISCIPVGEYECEEYVSSRFGVTYIVKDVVDRSGILFHYGNTARDTEGCILVGSSFNPELGGRGITNSVKAFYRFLQLLKPGKKFKLVIE